MSGRPRASFRLPDAKAIGWWNVDQMCHTAISLLALFASARPADPELSADVGDLLAKLEHLRDKMVNP
ncbi:unnamed protein product [uncultured bacterium]|nr:unnamed protein product [uncultured bacterium]